MQAVADNIRSRAIALGLSHVEVARRAGLSDRRFGHYVTGRREPDFQSLIRISEVLGVSPGDLLVKHAEAGELTGRALLTARLQAASNAATDDELRTAVVQLEAVLRHRDAAI